MINDESREETGEEAVEKWRRQQEQDIKESGPILTPGVSPERSPWGWGTLAAVCLFGGFAAGGIVAGINWRRMGEPGLMWPTIVVSVVTFIVLVYFLPEDVSRNTANLISLVPALGFWLWQKSSYRAWIKSHPGALRAGWQIPLVTVVIILGIFVGFLFLGGPATGTAEWHYNQGVDLSEQGRHDEAIAEYNKAIELDPEFAEAYCNRGVTYNSRGEFDKAIADFDKSIELDLKLGLTYSNRGIAYAVKGEFDKAIADFDKSIELEPEYAIAYFYRGLVYADTGEIHKAVDDLNKSIDLSDDPELIEVAKQFLDELRQ